MKACYFAWVRERIGYAEEEISPPEDVRTAGEVIGWLKGRGDNYAEAFANEKSIRIALDRTHVRPDAILAGAREIAFFPPMTGG